MYLLFYLLPAVFLIPAGIYLYHRILYSLSSFGIDTKKKRIRGIVKAAAAVIWMLSSNIWSIRAVIFLYIVGISIVLDLLYALLRAIHKKFKLSTSKRCCHYISRIYQSAIIPIAVTIIIFIAGYVNMHDVVEKDYSIKTYKSLRNEGYQLAMIADLHFGTTMDLVQLQQYCNEIAAKQPDMVLLCGDIVDENTTKEEMQQALKELSSIPSEFGTFYVYGNHDKAAYAMHPNYTQEELLEALECSGIHVLEDEVYQINDEFVIIGRKDASWNRVAGRLSGRDLVNMTDQEHFILLLDHQPVELKNNAALGVDLMLSGHTHGGQIWPVGPLSELLHINEMNYGYQRIDDLQIIVTSGIAGWGYPIRISGQSEYVMIEITSLKD